MINDRDRFRQDKSPYERPNFPFRCGRIRIWGKPCSAGPGLNGACGGVSECRPFKNGDRWECRRTPSAGGACENGPSPDGSCCIQAPPCRPKRSLRGYRGRIGLLAFAFVVAIIAAFGFHDGAGALDTSSPGDLSGAHANFTQGVGCVACHDTHDKSASEWIQAAWTPGDLSENCSTCHTFGGPAQTPHNKVFTGEAALAASKTECVMCHTEHKGAAGEIVAMTDQQCHACHEKKFKSFSNGHPAFSKDFPSRRRTAIAFNHTSHFDKHFQNKRFVEKAPAQRCVTCHNAANADRNVPVRSFETTCAACHENQIAERDLHLLTFPELEENPFDKAEIIAACGPGEADQEAAAAIVEKLAAKPIKTAANETKLEARVREMKEKLGLIEAPKKPETTNQANATPQEDEEFESVSTETLPPLAMMLLDVEDGEDPESYAEPVSELVNAMIESGDGAILDLLSERTDKAKQLLAGLSQELVRSVGCAWALNQEYEALSEPVLGGWYADELSLKYKPLRHGDPVVLGWLNLATSSDVSEDFRDQLLSSSEGAGACAKCHSVSTEKGVSDGPRKIEWRLGAQSGQKHVRYRHKPHLNLLGPGASCETCHKINPDAEFSAAFKQTDPLNYASNFRSIEKQTCMNCHAESKVKQECTLCHEYHDEHGFRKKMLSGDGGSPHSAPKMTKK